MTKYLTTILAVAVALLAAGNASAAAPRTTTDVLHLGPFTDTDTCSFPITTTVDRTRTTTTFAWHLSWGERSRHRCCSIRRDSGQCRVE